ncbi:hypothetical protein TNCV_1480641 [Trichonephila clavipes]|nr:hypothetical protein TNCV_1480641 [Trichonephila clavipes]
MASQTTLALFTSPKCYITMTYRREVSVTSPSSIYASHTVHRYNNWIPELQHARGRLALTDTRACRADPIKLCKTHFETRTSQHGDSLFSLFPMLITRINPAAEIQGRKTFLSTKRMGKGVGYN